MKSLLLLLLAALALSLALARTRVRPEDPVAWTLARYEQALRADDPAALARHLAPGVLWEDPGRLVIRGREAVAAEQLRRFRRWQGGPRLHWEEIEVSGSRASARVTARTGGGGPPAADLTLTLERGSGGSWRIAREQWLPAGGSASALP